MRSKLNKKGLYNLVFGTYRTIDYYFSSQLPVMMPKPADGIAVDVVIPAVAKDADTLPLCVEGIRTNTLNKIGGIYLVSPRGQGMEEMAQRLGLELVPEADVLGYGAKDINYVRCGYDRSGWLFQQLLKLSGSVGSMDYFVTVDADHVLIRPHTFVAEGGRSVFYVSKEYYYPYYLFFKRMFGSFPYQRLSYVAHKMVFEKARLSELKRLVERRSGLRWDRAIIDLLKSDEALSFSEFETYGHLFPGRKKTLLPWREKSLSKVVGKPAAYAELASAYGASHLAVTLPDYMKARG